MIPDVLYRDILKHVPVPTVDIVVFNPSRTKVLLFRRTNKPLKGVYFTPGGRLYKGERLLAAALRKAQQEVGIALTPRKLFLGGITEEIFPDSAFPGVSSHTINTCYGYVLTESETHFALDSQHDRHRWFSVRDKKLHPLIKHRLQALSQRKTL